MSSKRNSAIKVEEDTGKSSGTPKPEQEKVAPIKGLGELLAGIKAQAKNRPKKAADTSAKKFVRSHFSLSGLSDNDEMELFAGCVGTIYEALHENKVTLMGLIDMGKQCPCPKHTAAALAAEFIQMKWVGEA